MPPDYVIFACFCLVLYFYINQSIQFRSTASAIRSVFSGDCRMTCRQSQVSGFSGISGLAQGGQGTLQGPGPSQGSSPPSANCMCETCPCALIENFFLTCSPATRVYGALVAMVSQAYVNFLQSIQDAHEFVQNAATCRASCRKPQMVATSPFESNENFSFKDGETREAPQKQTERGLPAIKEATSKISLPATKTKFKDLFKKKKVSTTEDKKESDTSASSDNEASSTAIISSQGSEAGCPRCLEQGKTCLRECPKSKKP